MKNQKTALLERGEIIREIKKLFKIAKKYEKIIMGNSSASQKAAAIKNHNFCTKRTLQLMDKLILKDE